MTLPATFPLFDPPDKLDKADAEALAKCLHSQLGAKLKTKCCGKVGTISKDGSANNNYRFKCTKHKGGCGSTCGSYDFMKVVHEHCLSYKIQSLSIKLEDGPQKGSAVLVLIKKMDLHPDDLGGDLDSNEGEQNITAIKKRKLADTSMSHEDAEHFINEMSLEELRSFAINAHDRLVDAERRFEEVQTELTSQHDRISRLEARMNSPIKTIPTPKPTGGQPVSWADVALRNVPPERKAEVLHAREALKPVRPPTIPPAGSSAEADYEVRMVYVEGIKRMRYSELKGYLKSLGFSLTKIKSISFIGFSTVEFIVDVEYASRFINQIKKRTHSSILENFNPAEDRSNITSNTTSAAQACTRRLENILDREGTPWVVQKVIENWLIEKGLRPASTTTDGASITTDGVESMEVNEVLRVLADADGGIEVDSPSRQ